MFRAGATREPPRGCSGGSQATLLLQSQYPEYKPGVAPNIGVPQCLQKLHMNPVSLYPLRWKAGMRRGCPGAFPRHAAQTQEAAAAERGPRVHQGIVLVPDKADSWRLQGWSSFSDCLQGLGGTLPEAAAQASRRRKLLLRSQDPGYTPGSGFDMGVLQRRSDTISACTQSVRCDPGMRPVDDAIVDIYAINLQLGAMAVCTGEVPHNACFGRLLPREEQGEVTASTISADVSSFGSEDRSEGAYR